MARLIALYNPLDTSRRRSYDLVAGTELGAWLDEFEPLKGSMTRLVYVDGHAIDPEGYLVGAHDAILVQFRPGDYVTIGYYILQAVIAAAVGYVLSRIFAPSRPSAGNTPSPSQVYGLQAPRNAARLGEPIPVFYGQVVALPDYAAQPYAEYVGNDQYLFALLCIGQGECDVHAMLIGDSDASILPADVAHYQVFSPAQHASTFGVIEAATGVRENVSTSTDVADQELLPPNEASNNIPSTWYWAWLGTEVLHDPPAVPPAFDLTNAYTEAMMLAALPDDPVIGTVVVGWTASYTDGEGGSTGYGTTTWVAADYAPDLAIPAGSLVPPPGSDTIGVPKWVGPFESCKPGQLGVQLELDFVFPGGLFTMDNAGNLGGRSVTLTVEYQAVTDQNQPMLPPVVYTEDFYGADNTPLRFTRKHPTGVGRFTVKVYRSSNSDGKASTSERVAWTGLKFWLMAPSPARPVYGNVTMAAVVLRASNGIASDAASSIRFRVTRRLAPLGVGALVPTVNPADAFADIMLARYGANRPRNDDELDLPLLAALRAKWAYHNGFNAVFDQPSTVWEALTLSVQTVVAAPLPVGSRMSLVEDAPQPTRAQMFTDANIVAGSLQVTHQWDRAGTPAGVRVEFRDPRTFSPDAVFDPVGAPDYQSINLFGCTSREVALQHADLTLDRRRLQRVNATFQTEQEGLNCLTGDRIAIQAATMRWGQSAVVVVVDGLALHVSQPMAWQVGATHAVTLRDPQGRPHTVLGVVQGATADVVVLPGPPPFEIRDQTSRSEPTHLAFGVQGLEVTDWSVQRMRPQGSQVAIECINYVEAVWDRAAPHQRAA